MRNQTAQLQIVNGRQIPSNVSANMFDPDMVKVENGIQGTCPKSD